MRARCDICGGQQFINLPVRRPLVADAMAEPLGEMLRVESRQYPCPECSGQAPIERVALLEHHRQCFLPDGAPKELKALECEAAARGLGGDLLRGGFIRFTEVPTKSEIFGQRLAITATVAVASKADLGKLEERIQADREVFGEAVVMAAIGWINNFVSHYEAETARNCVRSGLADAKAAFTKTEIKHDN